MRAHSVKPTENAGRLAKERREAKAKREKEARRWMFHARVQSTQQALEVKKKLAEMAKSTARLERLKPPKVLQRTMYAQRTEERNKFEEMRSQSLKQIMLPPTGAFVAEPVVSAEAVPAAEEGNEGRASAPRRDSQPTIAAVAPAASSVPAGSGQAPPIPINTGMLIAESVDRLSKSRAEEKHAIFDVNFFRFAKKPKKKEKLPRSAARTGSALAQPSSTLNELSADSAANVV